MKSQNLTTPAIVLCAFIDQTFTWVQDIDGTLIGCRRAYTRPCAVETK
jgi:hypothetical protein